MPGPRSLEEQLPRIFKIVRILYVSGNLNITKIAEKVNLRYQTALNYVRLLERLGFVTTRSVGVEVIVDLTEKGRCIGKCLSE